MQKRISVDDLSHGMYVAALDRPWLETSFAFQGFPIRSDEEIAELRRQCVFVVIDVEQSSKGVQARLLALPSPRPVSPRTAPDPAAGTARDEDDPQIEIEGLTREVESGLVVYSDAKSYIDAVLEDIRLGRSLNTRRARQLVSHVVDSVVRNVNALLLLTNLKHKDEYTSQHCVNVCILAVAFGSFLGLDKHDLNDLGLGALLHDIGKMKVPLEILNKPGRLTEEEFAVIKGHPAHGRRILDAVDGLPERVLDVVWSHH
jgi:putative nucleotidyltransferase with HDIG domain